MQDTPIFPEIGDKYRHHQFSNKKILRKSHSTSGRHNNSTVYLALNHAQIPQDKHFEASYATVKSIERKERAINEKFQ